MKYQIIIGRILSIPVALLVSAWIEIDNAIGMPLIVEVALLVSAWIEITEVGGDAYKRKSHSS